jgi:2-keto-myo-inositol isomerase
VIFVQARELDEGFWAKEGFSRQRKICSFQSMHSSRRQFLAKSAAAAGLAIPVLGQSQAQAQAQAQGGEAQPEVKKESLGWQGGKSPWAICLDTTTLSPEIPVEKKAELAAAAGFDAFEPWDRDLKQHEEEGGNLEELGKKIRDLGMFVPSVIGLWGALANNEEDFAAREEEQRDRMRMIKAVGAEHVQVIPDFEKKDQLTQEGIAESYLRISEIALDDYGLKTGIIFLNAVPGLQTVADATRVGMLSGWKDPKIIPDTYHIYHGGSEPNSLRMLNGNAIAIFQFSDAPQGQERKFDWCDKERVLPGDGMLPLVEQLQSLMAIGYQGCISLELYNPEYREREPVGFLEEAFAKTLAQIEKAVAGAK